MLIKQLNVPFFSQLDSQTRHGYRMCFSSSCAMAVDYLMPGALKGHKDDEYLRRVHQYGDTTNPYAQIRALKSYGVDASYRRNLNLSDIEAQLRQDYPIPIGILHKGPSHSPSGGGHWITVVGMDDYHLIVNDPSGVMDVKRGFYRQNTNGDHLKYAYQDILPRWTVEGDSSGWGIIIT